MIQKLSFIAVGGIIGALLRYGVGGVIQRWSGGVFPWGTLVVNLTGAFAIGLLWEIFDRTTLGLNARLFLMTGLLGAYTTFSTYSVENVNMLRDGQIRLAAANILASTLGGLALVYAGMIAARGLFRVFK